MTFVFNIIIIIYLYILPPWRADPRRGYQELRGAPHKAGPGLPLRRGPGVAEELAVGRQRHRGSRWFTHRPGLERPQVPGHPVPDRVSATVGKHLFAAEISVPLYDDRAHQRQPEGLPGGTVRRVCIRSHQVTAAAGDGHAVEGVRSHELC